ncbi:hypothetical protein [Pseudoalteromonas virus vB_PspP-H6/1]|nr:hypothetical protein [Pseudoalteromonas virus vB_PspP-H6/1]
MFELEKLERIIRGDSSKINVYAYNATDTVSDILTSGYFPANVFDDAEVNIIDVYASDGFAPVKYDKPTATAIRNDVQGTGWAQYQDTQYTDASPFTVSQGDTESFPINGLSSITSRLPEGVASLYDGTRITPDLVGDFYDVRVNFTGYPSIANGGFTIDIDISPAGDGSNVIASCPVRMLRGSGSSNAAVYTVNVPVFALDTFVANGGLIRIKAENGNITLYGATLVIARVHKGG